MRFMILALLFLASTATALEFKIVTATQRGTFFVLGNDLCTYIAPDAGFDCEAVATAGSAENMFKLRFEPNVKFAIVNADLFSAFMTKAEEGNREAASMVRPLRVILRLHNNEIYFVVRADSPLTYIHEVKDARIAAGEYGSGVALTSLNMYQTMFHQPIQKPLYLSNEDALVKLTGDKSVDVVVILGGQPMKLLADMKPEAKQLLKFLTFDPANPASNELLKTYVPATIFAKNYPNLLSNDLQSVAVPTYLVTYDYNLQQTQSTMRKFARSLCQNFKTLQDKGHPKWREIPLDLPELAAGWTYYPPTYQAIKACAAPRAPPKAKCEQVEYALGLCGKP